MLISGRGAAVRLCLLISSAVFLPVNTVLAWGPTAHRASAVIAESYLSDEARLGIAALIGPQSLAEVSTWADEMRSNPSSFWQKKAGAWHYVTVPSGKLYSEVGAPERGDAVTALAEFRKKLLSERTSLAQRQLAFKFSLHIIADLHQPLHAGNGKDRGGNQIRVRFMGKNSNLHRVWDSGLIEQQQLSYSEWADWLGRAITPQQAQQWMSADPEVWIEESVTLRRAVYPGRKELGYEYGYEHLPALRERLQQSGVRIAAYFNALFSECSRGPQPVCVVQTNDGPAAPQY